MEGDPPDVCRDYVENVLKAGRVLGRAPFPFGQYTDDSQLARELVISYVENRRFDPADYARRIAALFSEGRVVGRGHATTQAANRLARGIPWDQAGTPPPAAGNGSAMRAGPIGLFFHDAPDRLVQAAYDQGRITHADPRCSAGAIVIASAVALALQKRPPDRPAFLARLADQARPHDPILAEGLTHLNEWTDLPPKKAVAHIGRVGIAPDHADGWQGISPFVTTSVLWSVYAFLRTPDDYWETICTAIVVGGDVDTTAAMAGAISGAHLGLGAVPDGLARQLTDRGTWEYDALVALARACWAVKRG